MKNLLVCSIIFLTSLALNSQVNKRAISAGTIDNTANSSDRKSSYIEHQSYLSESSVKDFKGFYADSLIGFNEDKVKAELLAGTFFGEEFVSMMIYKKRDFIKQKYKLGEYDPKNVIAPVPAKKKRSGGPSVINGAPCVNEDFETTIVGIYTGSSNSTAVTGWTVESTTSQGKQVPCNVPSNFAWTPGSPEFSIITTPVMNVPFIGTLPNSPLGGVKIAALNDAVSGFTVTRLSTSFPVTAQNSLYQFAYAGSWDGSGHDCCNQPFFTINLYDCNDVLLTCSSISLTPSGNFCSNNNTGYLVTPGGISYSNWKTQAIDLTPYIGSCITIRVINGDCSGGAHHGRLFFDSRCGGQLMSSPHLQSGGVIHGAVSYCAGANQAIITAPLGYTSYSWTAPPPSTLSASQATQSAITVTGPVQGSTYTVIATTQAGCQYTILNTIATSTVGIVAIDAKSSCAGGASGSATVHGTGSGSGYNYTWLNSNSVTVSTQSVATGLAAGVYTIILTGAGASGCGTAKGTATIGVNPPGVIDVLKPYCGTSAFLGTTGGTNFKWYFNNILFSTAPTVTVPAVHLNTYYLSYFSNQGCTDSLRFTLAQTTPGSLLVSNVPRICPGASNGTALLQMVPAIGGPTGLNTFSITSLGNTPPYSIGLGQSSNTILPLTGLSPGNYSVSTFDGSCRYNTTFSVTPYLFDYTLTPNSPTLCPGNAVVAGVNFSIQVFPSEFTYQWTPNIFLAGNASNLQTTIVTPTITPGTQLTTIYTVVVTPTLVNCPITKTVAITAAHPATPTITAIPNKCKTFPGYQINVNPTGGTFLSPLNGTLIPVNATSGILTPSNALTGVNSFTYSIAMSTCVAKQTATYEISEFNTAALTSSVPPLCVTHNPFNLMNIVQSTVNGNWSGTGVTGGTFDPSNLNTNGYLISYNTTSSPNPTVCPASSPLLVSVTKTITPEIVTVPEFCTNAAPFSMTVSPGGGSWSGTNNALSVTGLITPAFSSIGNSIANYSVAVGPCINYASTSIKVSQFISAGLTASITELCHTSKPVDLVGITQNTIGLWSGAGVQSNTFSPGSLSTGIYVLMHKTVSSPNATLCPDSRTLAVSVYNPPVPKISSVDPLCSNAGAIQLTVTPDIGTWVPSAYLSANGQFNPGSSSIGNNPVQYIIGTSTCNSQQTKFISVEAFVPAKIVSELPDQCANGLPLSLQPFVLTNSGTWSGAGMNGNTFYPALVGSGSFTLMHQTSSLPSGLCPDHDIISVNVFSLATPVINKAGPFCSSSQPIQIKVEPVGGMFESAANGVISFGGMFNPGSAFIGANIINYSITSGPCVAYAQTTISVEKFISADLVKQMNVICLEPGKVFPIDMNSYVHNKGGLWSNSDALTGSLFDPLKANVGKNNILVYKTQSSPTNSLCIDTSTIRIEIRELPVAIAASNTYSACSPGEITFNTPLNNNGKGLWYFDDGSEPQAGLTVNHHFPLPGKYNVSFVYTDDAGCVSTPTQLNTISIFEMPVADFILPSTVLISEAKVQLINKSTVLGNNKYEWEIKDLYVPDETHPFVYFPTIGEYRVTLRATSLKGCSDEITKSITIENDFNIYIPSSFSPNYDGLNDTFFPVFSEFGLDPKSYQMEIFDRWGEIVFRSKDHSKGWDGKTGKVEIKQDVYTYTIKYKDLEGKTYSKMGHVSVLK